MSGLVEEIMQNVQNNKPAQKFTLLDPVEFLFQDRFNIFLFITKRVFLFKEFYLRFIICRTIFIKQELKIHIIKVNLNQFFRGNVTND